jgi:hypothetical protein
MFPEVSTIASKLDFGGLSAVTAVPLGAASVSSSAKER